MGWNHENMYTNKTLNMYISGVSGSGSGCDYGRGLGTETEHSV